MIADDIISGVKVMLTLRWIEEMKRKTTRQSWLNVEETLTPGLRHEEKEKPDSD